VLHLKRFCYDVATNGVVKVGKHVRFGPELEIGPGMYLSIYSPAELALTCFFQISWYPLQRNRSPHGINCLGVRDLLTLSNSLLTFTPAVYHHGLSAGGGHYTLDVLHPNRYPNSLPNAAPREGWVRIDDELVSDVRPEDVFNAHERDDQRCAYLLFYRRV